MTQQNPAHQLMQPPPGYGYQGEVVQMPPPTPQPVQLVQPQQQYQQPAILPTAQPVQWSPMAYQQQPQFPQIQQPGQLEALGKIVDFFRERDNRQSQPQVLPSPTREDQFSELGTAQMVPVAPQAFQQEFQQNLSAIPTYGVSTPLTPQTTGLTNAPAVAPVAPAPTANVSTDVEKLRQANAQLNQLVTTLLHETKLAKQAIDALTPFVLQATVLTEFSVGQDKLIEYLKGFVLAETVLREFSYGQDKLIDYLSELLSDPQFLLYWAFEVWHQSKPSPEFIELLSSAYLHLSELHPPAQQTVLGRSVPANESSAYSRIAAAQQVVSQQMQNPLQPPQQQPAPQTNQINPQMAALISQFPSEVRQNGFQRPSVPAPPIPSQNSASNGWGSVRQMMESGNALEALRQVGKLSPQEWREMFNNQN